jgi:hypothetical protein
MAGADDLPLEQQKALRLGRLLLETNPEIAMDAKRLAKKADPNLRLPEVELEDKMRAEAAARAEWEEKQEQRQMEERVTARRKERDREAKAAGFTPEEIEKIVVDEKCSFETAMKLAELQRQSAEPGAGDVYYGGRVPQPRDMRGDPEWRKLSPAQQRLRGNEMAHQMIDDFIRKARRG